MYVVVETTNTSIKAKGHRCNNKEEGIEKIKERYEELTKNAIYLDRGRTEIDECNFSFAQVSDGMVITELYLVAC